MGNILSSMGCIFRSDILQSNDVIARVTLDDVGGGDHRHIFVVSIANTLEQMGRFENVNGLKYLSCAKSADSESFGKLNGSESDDDVKDFSNCPASWSYLVNDGD